MTRVEEAPLNREFLEYLSGRVLLSWPGSRLVCQGQGAAVRPADKKPRPALNFARNLTGVRQLDAHGGGGLMRRE
jgi:hypothetical protein